MLKGFINTQRIEERLKGFPIPANYLTVSSLFSAALGFFHPLFFLFAVILDGVDGMVARARGEATPLGAFIDGVSDRLVEIAMLTYFLITIGYLPWVILTLSFGSLMTSFVKAYAYYRKLLSAEEISKLTTLMGREERAIGILLSFVYPPLMILIGILALLTFLYLLLQILFKRR